MKSVSFYSRFVGLKENLSVINVKSRRDFAVSVEGERSNGSVNQGGKITSNLYVWLIHTFLLERAIF